ncbi:P-loop NTPase fold protein [Iodidimonas gelatinilytica]|nr:P-loop NTPase fold protein [Iodidimonas gelatinilytica]
MAATEAPQNAHKLSSDVPIQDPEDDIYGINNFTQAIAKSIVHADASEGLVLAVTGAWGSGKSSACNLILHHLKPQIDDQKIVPITFNPWWFAGAEALTTSFFQELNASIGKSLSKKARKAMASIGARVSAASPLIGGLAGLMSTPAAGAVVGATANLFRKFKEADKTVEQEHKLLSNALTKQDKRFLIIIDDIDRLGTDDALQIFRLIKSVGRLPNVIYLLAFDRILAEKMLAERFPSEGPSYLEKVIQGAFELPLPDPFDLRNSVLHMVDSIMGPPEETEHEHDRFWTLFHDITAALIKTPRDVHRLSNAIRVSWPAVCDDVNRADFLSIECLRLFLPTVHAAIRANKKMLFEISPYHGNEGETLVEYDKAFLVDVFNETFLKDLSGRDRTIAQQAILHLFPRTQNVWSRVTVKDMNTDSWQKNRRIASESHFPHYFTFSVNDETISAKELEEFLANAGDPKKIANAFKKSITQKRRRGGTKAALFLEELALHQEAISDDAVPAFLCGLFSVADDLNVEADAGQVFQVDGNIFRIHRLMNRLMRGRFDQAKRTELIEQACEHASLEWLESISNECRKEHSPNEEDQDHREQEPFITKDAAQQLTDLFLQHIRAAAEDLSLKKHRNMFWLLFRWRDVADAAEVKQWVDERLGEDDFVITLSEKFVSHIDPLTLISPNLDDNATIRDDNATIRGTLDIDRFQERVDELLDRDSMSADDRSKLKRFKGTFAKD